MLINLTQMSQNNIFAMQAILYQFKRYVATWKRLGCPRRMQWIWWQIVATPYMGFRLLLIDLFEMAFQFLSVRYSSSCTPGLPGHHLDPGTWTPCGKAGCWQINSNLSNISRKNYTGILNQYPFSWKITITHILDSVSGKSTSGFSAPESPRFTLQA